MPANQAFYFFKNDANVVPVVKIGAGKDTGITSLIFPVGPFP